MGSSNQNSKRDAAVITVETDLLKDKLNLVYSSLHGQKRNSISHEGLFEYLWDLKEMALMEGKNSVDLPSSWVEDLESEVDGARKH